MSGRLDELGELGIGLLGCEAVGSAVANAIARHSEGVRANREDAGNPGRGSEATKKRDAAAARSLFTRDVWHVATRPEVEVVIDVLGGLEPASGVIEAALSAGNDVVTAGKDLVVHRFAKLEDVAATAERVLLYEAAVMAGTPAISIVRSLIGDRIRRLQGVLNATSNYCLHRMHADGITLAKAAAEARVLGYAVPDAIADIEVYDAAAKLALLAILE